MTLIDESGRSWTLAVIGYQFPEAGRRSDRSDRNWLQVRVRCEGPSRAWERSDPALTTWDVAELVGWLRGHSADTIEFMEPSLAFERTDPTRLIMVLDHGLRPPASADSTEASGDWTPVRVEFRAPPSDFVATATSLAAHAARFPPR